MRDLMLVAAAIALVAAPLSVSAQDSSRTTSGLEQALKTRSGELTGLSVPATSAFVRGEREIAAGTTVKGPLAIFGNVRVLGTVDGDVYSYSGDIVVGAGGHITGSAIAISGRVQLNGGIVDGETRALGGPTEPIAQVTPREAIGRDVALTGAWAAVALLVGIGLLVFGGRTLDAVAEAVDKQFGRSFVIGIAATLGIVPGLALLLVALALTILGILLIPFAIVAYALAVLGLVALGFLAAVRAAGSSFSRRAGTSDRGAALRALVFGLCFFLALWMVAALLTPLPNVAPAARVVAFAVTWAAATVGLGASIITRAGTRPLVRDVTREMATARAAAQRALDDSALAPASPPPPEWQTPTPVSGVVATGRRPSSSSKGL